MRSTTCTQRCTHQQCHMGAVTPVRSTSIEKTAVPPNRQMQQLRWTDRYISHCPHGCRATGDDIPCAVCEVSTRSKHIMVPGTYECPSGWLVEYSGWLMTGHYGHKGRHEFVCLDKDPETVPGEANNDSSRGRKL